MTDPRTTRGSCGGPGEVDQASNLVPDDMMSAAEAARYLGILHGTITRWARTGRIPAPTTADGRLRFTRADLDAAYIGPPAEPPGPWDGDLTA